MASREDIEAAIEMLAARGEEPSVRKVRAKLENRGSFSSVSPVLAAWKEARAATAGTALIPFVPVAVLH